MGDKTQIAIAMLANAPVVWLGERMTRCVPLRTVHGVSAMVFLLLGVLALGWPAVRLA